MASIKATVSQPASVTLAFTSIMVMAPLSSGVAYSVVLPSQFHGSGMWLVVGVVWYLVSVIERILSNECKRREVEAVPLLATGGVQSGVVAAEVVGMAVDGGFGVGADHHAAASGQVVDDLPIALSRQMPVEEAAAFHVCVVHTALPVAFA